MKTNYQPFETFDSAHNCMKNQNKKDTGDIYVLATGPYGYIVLEITLAIYLGLEYKIWIN